LQARESICLTVVLLLSYKIVRVAQSCAAKILKTTTSSLHLDVMLLGVFFCIQKKGG